MVVAFSFIIANLLFITLGNTFGSIVSPVNFEPIARARIHLAYFLSSRIDLYDKYKHIIDKVKVSEPVTTDTKFVQAKKTRLIQAFQT